MLTFTVLFTVTALLVIQINDLHGARIQDLDIDKLLENYQNQQLNSLQPDRQDRLERKVKKDKQDYNVAYSSKYKNNDADSYYGTLSKDLLNLISKLYQKSSSERDQESESSLEGPQVYQKFKKQNKKNDDREQTLNEAGDKVFIKPNALVSDDNSNEDDGDVSSEVPSEYSKVYIVLNPDAVKKSRNQDQLKTLVSRILSLSNQPRSQKRKKEVRYRGFLLQDEPARRRLESNEKYYDQDMDDRPRNKRNRNEGGRGGGGGGGRGAGRTAIPYAGHRGDVYERDD